MRVSHFPLLLLVVYIAKSFFIPPEFFDGVVIFLNSILFGWVLYLDYNKKPDISQDIYDKIDELREDNKKMSESLAIEVDEKFKLVDGKLSTVNLAIQKSPKSTKQSFGWS